MWHVNEMVEMIFQVGNTSKSIIYEIVLLNSKYTWES